MVVVKLCVLMLFALSVTTTCESISILLVTSCATGHINPEAGVLRAAINKGHVVDAFTMWTCEKKLQSSIPGISHIYSNKIHDTSPGVDTNSGVLETIENSRIFIVDKGMMEMYNAVDSFLEKHNTYDVIYIDSIAGGAVLAGNLRGIPTVLNFIGPLLLPYKKDVDSTNVITPFNRERSDLPEIAKVMIDCSILLAIHHLVSKQCFQFIQETSAKKGLILKDSENDGIVMITHIYRHSIIIPQGPPQLFYIDENDEDDNVYPIGFIPDSVAFPKIEENSDLLSFIEGATKPLVYISMGTVVVMDKNEQLLLLKSFEYQEKFQFIWASKQPELSILAESQADKTKVFLGTYLPQGSILSHEKVKVFITHCGANSVQESVYAMKPMLVYPSFGDQPILARKVVNMGLGQHLDNFTYPTIEESLIRMLQSSNYDEMIEQMKIMRSTLITLGGYNRGAEVLEQVANGSIVVRNVEHKVSTFIPYASKVMLTTAGVLLGVFFLCGYTFYSLCCRKKVKTD